MRAISLKDLKANVESVLDLAQRDRLVVLRRGKPSAMIVGIEAIAGIESYDAEDVALVRSADFWQMIEERRHSGRSSPLAEVRARLAKKWPKGASAKNGKRTSKRS